MSTAIDNFTSQLHDNLEAVEDYAATSVYLAMAMIEEAEAAILMQFAIASMPKPLMKIPRNIRVAIG
jgi:hypothetical protein